MTREEELARLITEQKADDVSFVRDEPGIHTVSIDSPIAQIALTGKRKLTVSDQRHGTLYAAKTLGCKCAKCRKASADYQRQYNRRRGTKMQFVCACCGSTDVRRERVA